MQPLPGLDDFIERNGMEQQLSKGQQNSLIALIYISIILFFFMLCMAIYNTWVFLIKSGKYKVMPLTLFYVLVMLLCADRIVFSINFFNIYLNNEIIPCLMKYIIQLNLGIVQCWNLCELSLRVRQSIKFMQITTKQLYNSQDQ